jgi:hypothetical protein
MRQPSCLWAIHLAQISILADPEQFFPVFHAGTASYDGQTLTGGLN